MLKFHPNIALRSVKRKWAGINCIANFALKVAVLILFFWSFYILRKSSWYCRSMDQMDYDVVGTEILIALRGKRSRSSLSSKLGFNYNQVSRWETQKRSIDWLEFVALAEVCKVNISKVFKEVFNFRDSVLDQSAILTHFGLSAEKSSFAKSTRFSRYKVSRWLLNKQKIQFSEMLEIIDFCTTEFFEFLAKVVPIKMIPSVASALEHIAVQEKEHYSHPAAALVLSAIDLDDYKKLPAHTYAFIARKSGLSTSQVKEIIANLHKAKVIVLKKGKYETLRHQISPALSADGVRTILEYHQARNIEFIKAKYPSKNSSMGYQVFSMNSNQYEKIMEKYMQFYNSVCKIVNESQGGANQVYSLTVSILNTEDLSSVD